MNCSVLGMAPATQFSKFIDTKKEEETPEQVEMSKRFQSKDKDIRTCFEHASLRYAFNNDQNVKSEFHEFTLPINLMM